MVNFRCQKEMPTEGTQAAERGKQDASTFCADLLSRFAESVGIEISAEMSHKSSCAGRASQEAWGLNFWYP